MTTPDARDAHRNVSHWPRRLLPAVRDSAFLLRLAELWLQDTTLRLNYLVHPSRASFVNILTQGEDVQVRRLQPLRMGGPRGTRLCCMDTATKEVVWLARWTHPNRDVQWQMVDGETGPLRDHADPRDRVDLSDLCLTPLNMMHAALATPRVDPMLERAWKADEVVTTTWK